MARKEAILDRLPDWIEHESDRVNGPGMCIYKLAATGYFYVNTGDSYYDTEAPWDDWVAFARKIVAVDEAVRAGEKA